MPNVEMEAGVTEVSCAQVVIRCGCHPYEKADATWHGYRNTACPNPRGTEDLGVVSFWSKNPFRRLVWRLSRLLRGRKPGTAAVH